MWMAMLIVMAMAMVRMAMMMAAMVQMMICLVPPMGAGQGPGALHDGLAGGCPNGGDDVSDPSREDEHVDDKHDDERDNVDQGDYDQNYDDEYVVAGVLSNDAGDDYASDVVAFSTHINVAHSSGLRTHDELQLAQNCSFNAIYCMLIETQRLQAQQQRQIIYRTEDQQAPVKRDPIVVPEKKNVCVPHRISPPTLTMYQSRIIVPQLMHVPQM